MLQTSSTGTHSEISDGIASSYTLSVDDIDFFISLSCEPIRNDGARGPIVHSGRVGPIVPGNLIEYKFFFSMLGVILISIDIFFGHYSWK